MDYFCFWFLQWQEQKITFHSFHRVTSQGNCGNEFAAFLNWNLQCNAAIEDNILFTFGWKVQNVICCFLLRILLGITFESQISMRRKTCTCWCLDLITCIIYTAFLAPHSLLLLLNPFSFADSICQTMPDIDRNKSLRRAIRHGKAQDYLCSTFLIGKLASATLDLKKQYFSQGK